MEGLVAAQETGWLCCFAGDYLCALPLTHVIEIMRPQPVAPLAGAVAFVQGLAVIRGEAVPVISAALLFGGAEAVAERFVSLRGGAVLAVDRVLGVREANVVHAGALPPLLSSVAGDMVSAVAVLDAGFLLLLNLARLVPLAQQRDFAA
jgi:purine-binding chemotaxis protein CheW